MLLFAKIVQLQIVDVHLVREDGKVYFSERARANVWSRKYKYKYKYGRRVIRHAREGGVLEREGP